MIPIAYWRNRRAYTTLLGSRCRACGAEFFPPVRVCRKCKSKDIEAKEMPRKGTLITYTKLTEPAEEFGKHAPIYLGLIGLSNGVRLVSTLADVSESELNEGAPVSMVIRRWTEDGPSGIIYYGYKFRVDAAYNTG